MIRTVLFEIDLLFANRLESGSGYTWTLASRLGEMLRLAEHQFGPRDKSFTILGVEFGPDDHPRIWYPGDCGDIVIQLTPSCATDLVQACYQLSHECIHLLAPSGNQNANNLEEGLATHFSQQYITEKFQREYEIRIQEYVDARNAVVQLLAIDSTAILRLRQLVPSFLAMSSDDILKVVPDIAPATARFLCTPFIR
jgi:hypothetical protein